MSTTSGTGKNTIYVDIDDEITAIIDKVRASDEKIVALVLPKRATVLQSIVNMKLLKRVADESKKRVVLITNEAGLLPLAGSVGLHVAKTLQSKPEIPDAPTEHAGDDESEDAVEMADDADELDKSAPVGEHMKKSQKAAATAAATGPDLDEDQPIELDNTGPEPTAAGTGKKSKGKRFNIPNFDKFRLWIIVGGVALVVFVVMWYMAFVSLPRASITIKTDSSAVQASLDVTFDTEAESANIDEGIIPAEMQSTQKTFSQAGEATGQKDNGTKASGTVSMNAGICGPNVPSDVPAGAGLSANGLTYITQAATNFTPKVQKGKCNWVGASDTPVIAQSNGDKYNVGDTTLSVAGRADVTATTGGIGGGTSNIVKVVSQNDVDNAKQKIAAQDTAAIKQELKQGLTAKGWMPIEATFKAGEPETTVNPAVGTEASNFTVTEKITYSMMGVKEGDLKKVIANDIHDKIDQNKQAIIDYGLDDAVYKIQNQQDTTTLLSLDATAIAGSDLNLNEIKKQVAGKKTGDAKKIIGEYPGVTNVEVHYSPFWVSSIPKSAGKINIIVEKPEIKKNDQQ